MHSIRRPLRDAQHTRPVSERVQRRLTQSDVDDEALLNARRPRQQERVGLPGAKFGPPAAAVSPLRPGVDPAGDELDEISQLEQVVAEQPVQLEAAPPAFAAQYLVVEEGQRQRYRRLVVAAAWAASMER